MARNRILVLLALSVALLALPVPAARVLSPGDFAPPLSANDLSGTRIKVDFAEKRFTFVNFWGTWCDPCPDAMRALAALHEERAGDGLAIVGVLFDPVSDAEASRFAEEIGIPYPLLRADAELMRRWGNPQVLPATFLVNAEGKILRRYVGGAEMTDGIVADANSILEGGPLTTLKLVPLVPPKR